MPGHAHSDLFAHYLSTHPECPTGVPTKLPQTAWGLFQLSGYSYGLSHARNPDNLARLGKTKTQGEYSYYRWQDYARIWPELRDWLSSDECWISPDAWPEPVAEVMPEVVTPFAFALGMLPQDQETRRGAILYKAPKNTMRGLSALSAYAHGWRVRPAEYYLMRAAVEWLLTTIPFSLWVYNPILDIVPVPDKPSPYGLFWPLSQRRIMQEDPLVLTNHRLRAGLPERARNLDYLMALPRQPFDPCRTSKTGLLAVLALDAGKERRRDWIDFYSRWR